MAEQKGELVQCGYIKCNMLHKTKELTIEDSVMGGKKYYHPDCYHMMQTINEIRDLFYHEIDPTMTGKQVGQLVSVINNMVYDKYIDVDKILFSLRYFIKYKPGKLRYPAGLAYIVQDKDVVSAWEREKQRKIKEEIKEEKNRLVLDEFVGMDLSNVNWVYKPQKQKSFADILR